MQVTPKAKLLRGFWMLASMVAIFAVLYSLVHPPRATVAVESSAKRQPSSEAVRVEADGSVTISPDSPLTSRLKSIRLTKQRLTHPALVVSGAVLARIVPGESPLEDRWQFSTSELSATYADWLRVRGEVEFAQNQLKKTQELTAAEISFLDASLKRYESLAERGSLPERNLRETRAELLKARLQGEKDEFAAQSLLRTSLKTKGALERQLSQAGIETVVFGRAVEHMVLVAANVPEAHIAEVRVDQGCVVEFFAYPNRVYEGHVETLGQLLTAERRTLRVLFELNDPENQLKPGLFAEVGLGTDPRDSLSVPADSLLHIGAVDYVLVESGEGRWRPARVHVGSEHDGAIELLEGLQDGDTVMAHGAILLKPAVVKALTQQSKLAAAQGQQ